MSNRNLPYIPIYIGDWEKDCNVLSLEAEAAWTRVIFKMFTNGKQSSYKIPTKGLQNLWRVSAEKVEEIIQEFLDYNICIINRDGHYVEFICRRYVKENKISEVRKAAVQSRKDRTKGLQNSYKKDTKGLQNTEIENEIEIENDSRGIGIVRERENYIVPRLVGVWMEVFPSYARDDMRDFEAVRKISEFIAGQLMVSLDDTASHEAIVERFKKIAEYVSRDDFWKGKPLFAIEKHIQEFFGKTGYRRPRMVL